MEYDIEFLDDDAFDVVIRTSGEATAAGFADGRERLLADPRLRPGMTLIIDHSRLDVSTISTADVRGVADATTDAIRAAEFARLVVVASGSAGFGLTRLSRSVVPEDVGDRVTVVRSVDEAYRRLDANTPAKSPRHR